MSILHQSVTLPLGEPAPPILNIDRWYQMDDASLALAQFGAERLLGRERPVAMVICSQSASNESDQAFVQTQMTSPQRFVHTLPSVRMSPLCQLLRWQGPVLCLQGGGERGMADSLREACDFLPRWPHLWWLGVARRQKGVYDLALFDLTPASKDACRDWMDYGDLRFWERLRQMKESKNPV